MNNQHDVELDQVEDWEVEYNAFCDEQELDYLQGWDGEK